MTKLCASAVVLGLALFGCAQSSDNGGSGPSGTGGSLGSADAAATGGKTGTGGGSASGGSTGTGGSGTGGSSAGGGSSGSTGTGGSSAGGSSGTGGGSGGSGAGGSAGDAAASDGGYVWKNCLEPVYSSILPDEFCMVYEAVCTFVGTNHYKSKAECMTKFKGGASDADACKSGHLCRASKDPAMREMDCQTSALSACRN